MGKKILLVEDDPLLIDIYTTKLEGGGYRVAVEEKGDRVIEAIQEEKPDLIILDIVLPNQDGWAILQDIRSRPEFSNIKVVVLSNLGQKEEVEKGLKLGAVKYLIKAHYTPTQVLEEINHLVGEQ